MIAAQRSSDHAERTRLYLKAQQIIHDDCPMIPLVHMPMQQAHLRHIRGFVPHPMGLIRLANVKLQTE